MITKHQVVVLALLVSIAGQHTAHAAQKITIDPSPSFLIGTSSHAKLQDLGQDYQFKTHSSVTLPSGMEKNKKIQYYKGIPVWGASITTNAGRGFATSTSGQYIQGIEDDIPNIAPNITETKAMELAHKVAKLEPSQTSQQNIKTIIILDKQNVAHLAYIIDFVAHLDEPSRPHIIISSKTGATLDYWEGLGFRLATGPGGNEKTGKYYYGTEFSELHVSRSCAMKNKYVETYDMNHKLSGGKIHEFNCPENNEREVNGAYAPLNDAHYFGGIVFDMYQSWYDTKPLNFKLKMRVHYGKRFENAFWDGRQMTFGDGYKLFYPLVSLDVVAHEVSHGFTEQNSNLVYRNQSGGINEAFSDMAGEAAKYFMNYAKPESERNDWLVGSSIFKKENEALRYFADPTQDGRSIAHADDYYDGLDVHYSSGVFNKAFYLLATTPDWNTKSAFDVFYLANKVYWREDSDFDDAACGVHLASKDYGYEDYDVLRAFEAVGVNASCTKSSPVPENSKLLTNKQFLGGQNGYLAGLYHYHLKLEEDSEKLEVTTKGGIGDLGLFIAFDRAPSIVDYDCTSSIWGTNQECVIHNPVPGTYHIMLQSRWLFLGVGLQASWD